MGLLVAAVVIGVTSFKQTMTPYIGFAEARAASGLVQVNGMLASKDYVLKPRGAVPALLAARTPRVT